ncbi:MAG: ABC transporter ATP-binding protein [Candidatus Scalindua sp.]|nr:ABC transporter ATP-binding protein [Candidatus Scalindua sp.]
MNDKDIAIKVENIGKCYRIGMKENVHDTFGKSMFNFLKNPLKNYLKYRSLYNFNDISPDQDNNHSDIVWALRDVSFEVKKGEVVGIIGINGAGKSTLLKILSKITAPTTGRATIYGRISSLLEVGTGFHQELTGRENVYLNGTILGMRKKEIDQKFDEIVDFSGIEKFIDTPVKRYSSGMRVRLAFAVAAYLEPEILLIDEVLAVGDVRFQKKCLDKMKDVGHQGRTVLFVSHNMQVVTRLCPRTILLNGGRVQEDGPSHHIVGVYMNCERAMKSEREWNDLTKAPGDEVVRLCAIRVKTEEGQVAVAMDIHRPVKIEIEYEVLKPGHVLVVYYHVINEDGIEVFTPVDSDPNWRGKPRPVGRYISTSLIPANLLSEGLLFIGPRIRTLHPEVRRVQVKDAVAFQVVDNIDNTVRGELSGRFTGVVSPHLKWETQFGSCEGKTPAIMGD